MQINSIIIVGGGSSGWFTASMLSKHCPEIDVTLVESPNVPTIGVGESTLGQINQFFGSLDMKDEDWMPACNATYKASIKFTDFHKKGEAFHYPFGNFDYTENKFRHDDWFLKKWLYPETPYSDFADTYWPAMPLIKENKIYFNEDNLIPNFNPKIDYAYHMDATLLGNWMRDNLCKNINHILDDVVEVNLDRKGWISSITLKEENPLVADLYIDCTGFKSLLLEQSLGVKYISFNDILINNNAWTCHIPYDENYIESEMEVVTNCTAIENGWVWNIPLWNRIGSGYVYSDKFIDSDTALKEYQDHIGVTDLDFKHIKIKNGKHERSWVKNCIAIGLSNAFVEPLESTGLLSTHDSINMLIKTLHTKDRHINQFDRECFNREFDMLITAFKHFVGMHFYLSSRDDTEYWNWYTQELGMPEHFYPGESDALVISQGQLDEDNYTGIKTGRINGTCDISRNRFQYHTMLGLSEGQLAILSGHHWNIYSDYIRTNLSYNRELWAAANKDWFKEDLQPVFDYWDKRKLRIERLAKHCPTQYEYLGEHIYK